MDRKTQKGQALLEMAIIMTAFWGLWLIITSLVDLQKKEMNRWGIGHETKIQSQKNRQARKSDSLCCLRGSGNHQLSRQSRR